MACAQAAVDRTVIDMTVVEMSDGRIGMKNEKKLDS
jgi:hypothetical protein